VAVSFSKWTLLHGVNYLVTGREYCLCCRWTMWNILRGRPSSEGARSGRWSPRPNATTSADVLR